MIRLERRHLKRAKFENVQRLARWLRLKHIDGMSQNQLSSLIVWLVTRHDKKLRGMTHSW